MLVHTVLRDIDRLHRTVERIKPLHARIPETNALGRYIREATRTQRMIDEALGHPTIQNLLAQTTTSQRALQQALRTPSSKRLADQIANTQRILVEAFHRSAFQQMLEQTSRARRAFDDLFAVSTLRQIREATERTQMLIETAIGSTAFEEFARQSIRTQATLTKAMTLGPIAFAKNVDLGQHAWINPSLLVDFGHAVAAVADARSSATASVEAIRGSLLLDSADIIERFIKTIDEGVQQRGPVLEAAVEELHSRVISHSPHIGSKYLYFINTIAIISFIINVLMAAHTISANVQTSKQLSQIGTDLRSLNETVENIADELSNLQPSPQTDVYYVITSDLNLRDKPSKKGKIIDVLRPNQWVKFISRNGRWLSVEAYDYLLAETRSGWIYGRYAKMIEMKLQTKTQKSEK